MSGRYDNIKILVANRGEIAVRIFKTLKKMGISSVAIYAKFENKPSHSKHADYSIQMEGDRLQNTYLNIDQITKIAKMEGCFAIHPGYGFLSENPEFVKKCAKEDIVFIGPSANVIELMGDKKKARNFAEENGIPTLKSYSISDKSINQTDKIQFPVVIKAVHGGGGRGMRIVHKKEDLQSNLELAQAEALKYFGNGDLYIEKYLENPRHIEVQILGDQHGNIVHLYERECSIQRRFQKIVEETPAPGLNEDTKNKLYDYALKLAKTAKYENAGTIEFLVDQKQNIHFLEVNTRIQVEHPITEMVTGIDLVKEQVKISMGSELSLKQNDISIKGHAIECRICAEDPSNNFKPSIGTINLLEFDKLANARIDTGYGSNDYVSTYFDSMLAKSIVWDKTRNGAIHKSINLLQNSHILGVKTNISYLINILKNSDFQNVHLSTSLISKYKNNLIIKKAELTDYIILASIHLFRIMSGNKTPFSNWRNFYTYKLLKDDYQESFFIIQNENNLEIKNQANSCIVETKKTNPYIYQLIYMDKEYIVSCIKDDYNNYHLGYEGESRNYQLADDMPNNQESYNETGNRFNDKIISPIHGKISKIKVSLNKKVEQGDILLIIESMKIENSIIAPKNGIVNKIAVREGEQVETNGVLMELK